MATVPPLAAAQLPDGVYLDLKESDYFAQDRLGSSDLIRLALQGEGWWWRSRHNPDGAATQTDAQNYGSGLHAIMLEGLGAYETRFAIEPDKREFERLLVTVEDMRTAIEESGIRIDGVSKMKAPDWARAVAEHLPGANCWPNIVADFDASRAIRDEFGEPVGLRPSLTAVEDRMLRLMYEIALEDPDIRPLIGVGEQFPSLAEVSYFWTDHRGLKRRARFDKPVPTFTLDLKSLGNWQGRDLRFALGDIILKSGYHIQVGDQHEARLHMQRTLVEQGDSAIDGGSLEERAWLMAMAQRAIKFDWVWLFYQKPEPSGRAPVLFPLFERWGGPFHKSGYRLAQRAADFYVDRRARFGLQRPWYRVEPLHVTEALGDRDPAPPHITLPQWGWADQPAEDEDAHFDRRDT